MPKRKKKKKKEANVAIGLSTSQVQQILKNVKDLLEWHLSAHVTCSSEDGYAIIEDNGLCKLSRCPASSFPFPRLYYTVLCSHGFT